MGRCRGSRGWKGRDSPQPMTGCQYGHYGKMAGRHRGRAKERGAYS